MLYHNPVTTSAIHVPTLLVHGGAWAIPAGVAQAHESGVRNALETGYAILSRGGKGVKNVAVTPRIGRVSSIQLVDDTSELMVISQFGKIIRIDTKTIRAAGRATQGVRLLNLEADDKVAAAVIIPPEELKEDDEPTLLQ